MHAHDSAPICLLAHVPTSAVTDGFLPAAAGLDRPVTLLTDQPQQHAQAYRAAQTSPPVIVGCDVWDYRAVIRALAAGPRPAAVLTNSDHLQTQAALAAGYLDLPAKDWRATLRARDKGLLRRHLAAAGMDTLPCVDLGEDPGAHAGPNADMDAVKAAGVSFPCVVKPREGVASEDVYLVADAAELSACCRDIRARRPGLALVVEQFLAGSLYTLETLGDGHDLRVLGGFRTTLSAPPRFVEQRMDWLGRLPAAVEDSVLTQLRALGVGLGACHTEFVIDADRARLIEVNDRLIGDQCDLFLSEVLDLPLFAHVLRLHLGQRLDTLASPRPVTGHARIQYVTAMAGGVVTGAPGALDRCDGAVRLDYRPLRANGDDVALTGTNRDYLGLVRAVGPDAATVDRAVADLIGAHQWGVTTCSN